MKDWIYGYRLEFTDGGEPEYQVLGDADTEEECERIAETIPAITYKGRRPVREAAFVWCETDRGSHGRELRN